MAPSDINQITTLNARYNGIKLPWLDINAFSMEHFAHAAQAVGLRNDITDINLIHPGQKLELLPWLSDLYGSKDYIVKSGDTLNEICATIMKRAFDNPKRFTSLLSAYNSTTHTVKGDRVVYTTKTHTPLRFPHWTGLRPLDIPCKEGLSLDDLHTWVIGLLQANAQSYWSLVQIHNVNAIPYVSMWDMNDRQLKRVTSLVLPTFNGKFNIRYTPPHTFQSTQALMNDVFVCMQRAQEHENQLPLPPDVTPTVTQKLSRFSFKKVNGHTVFAVGLTALCLFATLPLAQKLASKNHK